MKHFRETLLLALPVSLGQLGHILTMVADSVMLGRYNSSHLAASVFAGSVYMPFMIFCLGCSMGITPLIAQAIGAKKLEKLNSLFNNALLLYLVLGVVFTILFQFLTPLLSLMNQPKEVALLAPSYFKLLSFSMVPIMLFQVAKQYAEGWSDTFWAMIISLGCNLINIVLNYLFIYGNDMLNIAEMGLVGAGYSTLIARVLMAIIMLWYIFKTPSLSNYITIQLVTIQKNVLREIMKFSVPMGTQFFIEVSAFAFSSIIVGTFGKESYIAAHQIAFNVATVTFILASGISAAVTVRVGNFFGAKDKQNANKAFYVALFTTMAFMGFSALIIIATREFIPYFYMNENEFNMEIYTLTIAILGIAAIFQLSDGIQLLCVGALRGLGDVNISMWISIIAYWFIAIPVGCLLAFVFDMEVIGIWWGFVAGLSCSAILLFLRFRFMIRKLDF